jgi:hypothetical protein
MNGINRFDCVWFRDDFFVVIIDCLRVSMSHLSMHHAMQPRDMSVQFWALNNSMAGAGNRQKELGLRYLCRKKVSACTLKIKKGPILSHGK